MRNSDEQLHDIRPTPPSQLSPAEEFANFLTHGIGLVLSLAGVAVMATVLGRGDAWRVAGCTIYLASLIGVYLMSTLSHTFTEPPRLRSLFRALDQGTIYLLIAATYTPFSMAYLHYDILVRLAGHRVDDRLLGILLQGVLCPPTRIGLDVALHRSRRHPVHFGAGTAWASVSIAALWWMLLGVACYTLGLVFWLNDHRVRHFHAVWHVLVIAGSTCHFVGILLFVVLRANPVLAAAATRLQRQSPPNRQPAKNSAKTPPRLIRP